MQRAILCCLCLLLPLQAAAIEPVEANTPKPTGEPSAEAPPADQGERPPRVVAPDRQVDLFQPISMAVTGWLPIAPAFNHHLLLALSVPVIQSPWTLVIDALPTLGTGGVAVGHVQLCGPVYLMPALGLRYFGAGTGNADGFLYGPQGRLGISVPLLSWLAVTGRVTYAPWLPAMNRSGAGSFVEMNASLAAHVGRLSYSIGYTAMVVDPLNAGVWPRGTFLGGPSGGAGFSF